MLAHRILVLGREQSTWLPSISSRLVGICPESLLHPAIIGMASGLCLLATHGDAVPICSALRNKHRQSRQEVFYMCGCSNVPPEQILRVHLPQCTDLLIGHLHHGDSVLQVPVEPRVCPGSAGCIRASGC